MSGVDDGLADLGFSVGAPGVHGEHYQLNDQRAQELAADLVDKLSSELPPVALLDIARMLVFAHAGVTAWQDAGMPPLVRGCIEAPSREEVRKSLGGLVGILRTLRLM